MAVSSRLKAAGVAGVAFVALVTGIVKPWEGRSLTSYRDIVGVWTICDGVTKGVRANQRATHAECDKKLLHELEVHEAGMLRCLKREMPRSTHAAMLSLTYNIGVGAFCRSTAARRINAGDFKGACKAATRFNRAGGRKVRGLVNRRAAEFKICMEDL